MGREQVFKQLRSRLRVELDDAGRKISVASRLSGHSPNTIPERTSRSHAQLITDFEERIVNYKATVTRISDIRNIPLEISSYLNSEPVDLCLSDDVRALELPFDEVSLLSLVSWSPKKSLGVSVTCCFGAVAETGSLVVTSSSQNGISQNLLGEKHIVILMARDVVGAYEEIWQRIREHDVMPRDITFVSGPSCTGDIEMVLEYGAHGPRELHVLIVMEDKNSGDSSD